MTDRGEGLAALEWALMGMRYPFALAVVKAAQTWRECCYADEYPAEERLAAALDAWESINHD